MTASVVDEGDLGVSGVAEAPGIIHVVVDDVAPGTPISDLLWGVFFEDLNNAADGGLYAELIANRSFSYTEADHPGWHGLTGWTLVGSGSDAGSVTLSGDQPASDALPQFAVLRAERGSLHLVNDGFDGIALHAGESYRLRVLARVVEGEPTISASLLGDGREVLAAGRVGNPTGTWEWYELSLEAAAEARTGRLQLTVAGGTVALAMVSLMPVATFRGDENGLRRDLAEAIEALRPRFLRFPGGCLVHGLGLANVYHWSDTVGPVENRCQQPNLWGYHQSMGLGYYEYFRFAEQIGAEPVPVVAAGVCCQNAEGGQAAYSDGELAHYVDEVLQLVEFANGSPDSRWGSVRAEMGHPEPFGMRYLGIGNEDEQTEGFRTAFRVLYDALRSRHPEITVIGTLGPFPDGQDHDDGWAFARELQLPVVDEHCYRPPRWYFENLDRFADLDRAGPKVYVGEYAAKGNSLLCAMAEAAYMSAMEANGDVVAMASYAPLLARVGATQWQPDLLYFDNQQVLRTFNYHVQAMHSWTAGSHSLPVQVTGVGPWRRQSGGVGAVRFSAESAHIRLTDVMVGAVRLGALDLAAGERSTDLAAGRDAGQLRFSFTVQKTGGEGGMSVAFGDFRSDSWFELQLGSWKNRSLTLCRVDDGYSGELDQDQSFSLTQGSVHHVEVAVSADGHVVTVCLDGRRSIDFAAPEHVEKRFLATAVTDESRGGMVIKLVNAQGRPQRVRLETRSGRPIAPAVVTSLAGEHGQVGLPFEEAPIGPKVWFSERPVTEIDLPGYAFVTLDWQAKQGARPQEASQ